MKFFFDRSLLSAIAFIVFCSPLFAVDPKQEKLLSPKQNAQDPEYNGPCVAKVAVYSCKSNRANESGCYFQLYDAGGPLLGFYAQEQCPQDKSQVELELEHLCNNYTYEQLPNQSTPCPGQKTLLL